MEDGRLRKEDSFRVVCSDDAEVRGKVGQPKVCFKGRWEGGGGDGGEIGGEEEAGGGGVPDAVQRPDCASAVLFCKGLVRHIQC